jgi:hypothetical protein
MTHSFIKTLECQPHTTYGHLLTSMKNIMRQGGACKLQGPVGGSIHKVANFSGVEVSNIFLLLAVIIVQITQRTPTSVYMSLILQEPQLSSSQNFNIDREPFCM